MEKIKETLRFNSSVLNVEYSNSQFSKAKIRVMYAGHNRNGSFMSKESIDNAVNKSLAGVPIIGYYVDDDFTDHDVNLDYNEKTDEVEWTTRTVPYGFIPKEAETYWESVVEYDGTVNDYLVVDGAILWTGRYKEAQILTQESRNHSMEINIINGQESVIDRIPTFNVTKFEFTGLCILANTTEPCFESSIITAFNLNEQVGFKKEFDNMLFALKDELKNLEGGTDVAENTTNEVVETEVDATTEETQVESVETDFEQVDEQSTEQVDETVVDEFAKDDKEDEDEDKSDDSDDDSEAGESDDEDEKKKKYEAEDEGEDVSDLAKFLHKLQKYDEDLQLEKSTLHEDGSLTLAGGSNEGSNKNQNLTVELQVDTSLLKEELAEFQAEFEKLEAENAELKAYKHKRESEDLRAQFGNQVTDEEFEATLAANEDLTVVEEKLYALIGKKTYAFESTEAKTNKQKLAPVSAVENDSPFGSFFD